jgi:hypothetical protein
MRHDPGKEGWPPRQDEVTVRLSRGAGQSTSAEPPPADGVTVLVPGAVLASAPTPQGARGEAPVFVDDSGSRKRLLRLAGVLIALLSIGFIAIVGVALAVPSVATSVGLGNVLPFIVPGGAALPVRPSPPTPHAEIAQPKPTLKPAIVAAPTTEPVAVAVDPTTTPAPVTETSVTTVPTATQATATAQAPVTQAPGGTQVPGGGGPVDANPPTADANVVGHVGAPAGQATSN